MRVGIRATRIIKTKAFDNVASNVYSKCICSCVCSLPWRESAHEGFTSSYEGGKWRVGAFVGALLGGVVEIGRAHV